MLEKRDFYRTHPKFNDVFSELYCGLQSDTLVAQLRDGRWYLIKFRPFQGKYAALYKETPRPPDGELARLEYINSDHTLN